MSRQLKENILPHKKGKTFIALSGGVDSAIAAATLIEAGFDCKAVYMKLYDQPLHSSEDARQVAADLGIPFEILDLSGEFEHVIDYFCSEYQKARTPNPCVFCNRYIKFGKFLEYAKANSADFIATGHYAQIVEDGNQYALYAADNTAKDQSYALAMIEREAIEKIILPLGRLDKSQTRQIANQLGLKISDKPDSQEICFIPDNDYAARLESDQPQLKRQGNIIDSTGKILGTHNGIHRFTIGQRRGLKVAMGKPWYVTKLDAVENTVTLGPVEELICSRLLAENINWLIDKPQQSFAAMIKIRYNHRPVAGKVSADKDKKLIVEFEQPVRAVTPGQAVVFYLKTDFGLKVAGAGWIEKALD